MVSEPDPIGVDAIVPARRSALARVRSRLRLAVLRIRARGRLRLEGAVHVGGRAAIGIAPGARVTLGDGCVLGEGARIEAAGGEVRLGARTWVGASAVLRARTGVTVGADCLIGDCACIDDAAPTFAEVERPIRGQPLLAAPVAIGDRARIGAHAAVLPGVTVGAGAVVGPYAVVAGDLPDQGTSSGAGVA